MIWLAAPQALFSRFTKCSQWLRNLRLATAGIRRMQDLFPLALMHKATFAEQFCWKLYTKTNDFVATKFGVTISWCTWMSLAYACVSMTVAQQKKTGYLSYENSEGPDQPAHCAGWSRPSLFVHMFHCLQPNLSQRSPVFCNHLYLKAIFSDPMKRKISKLYFIKQVHV